MIKRYTIAYKKRVEIVDTYKTTEYLYVFPTNGDKPYSALKEKMDASNVIPTEFSDIYDTNWQDIYGCYLYSSRTTEARK